MTLLVFWIGLSATTAQAEPTRQCFAKPEAVKPMVCSRTGVSFDVPSGWDAEVRQYHNLVTVADRSGECEMQFTLTRSSLSPEATARLYENLYFGPNLLTPECGDSIRAELGLTTPCIVGQYSQRLRDNQILALFGTLNEETVVGILRCTRVEKTFQRWGTMMQTFGSLRKVEEVPEVAEKTQKWMSNLVDYLRRNIDLSRLQVPVPAS